MRYLALAASCLATSSLLAQDLPTATDVSRTRTAFEQFEESQGGTWIVKWHPATGTPATIYGTGLKIEDWGRNSLEEGRRCAERLLTEQADLLGVGTSSFQEVIGARMGRSWSFTYDQFFRGVPVIEGRVDVRINMSGVVAMLGSRAWPVPADFVTVPTIDEAVAKGIAWTALGGEPNGQAAAPRLVIWGDIASPELAPFFLAWEVSVHQIGVGDDGKTGRYYVDAHTGRVLHFQNDKHDCRLSNCTYRPGAPETDGPSVTLIEAPSVLEDTAAPVPTTVTVFAWTRTGNDAFSSLVNIPFPGLEVSVPGFGTQTTDENGEFVININSSVNISINGLNGRHHTQISGSSAPSGSVTVQPGVNATIQLLSANASTAQAAHTSASYWTDRSNEWARSILGNTPQLNIASSVNITVNNSSTCNATYNGGSNTTTYYSAGGGCQNTAFSSVVAHEWGHGLDNRYGGISNSVAEGLSEGWGDIIGMYQIDSPILGSGFQSPGQGIRNGNNSRVWPYSSGVSPHGAGEVWMGWAWRLREALRASLGTTAAIQISEDIVISSIVADATNREDAVLEVFIADDDDGNLLNGTPHYNELEQASIQKGIPYPVVPAFTPFGQACDSSTPVPPPTCPQINANGGTLANTLRDNEYCYTVNNSSSYEVLSFEIYSGTTTGGNVTCPAHIYLDDNGDPEPNPIATTTIVIGSAPGFYTATFAQPVPVDGTYYLGFDTSSNNVYLNTLNSGTSGSAFWRDIPNGTTSWTPSGLIQNPSWRVNCQAGSSFLQPQMSVVGTPEIGTTYQPRVTDAPTGSPAVLVSGLSDQVSQSIPLPAPLPGAPGCNLLVSLDALAATATNAAGSAQQPFAVPNQPALVGLQVFHQWFIYDQAANALGFIASDGGRALIRN